MRLIFVIAHFFIGDFVNILLTGGLGYIGSHTAIELISQGHIVHIYDNLSNSDLSVIDSINKVTGKAVSFYEGDIRDEALLISILTSQEIDTVIHFAGLKSVGESVHNPLAYYENNVCGSLTLLKAMKISGVKSLIFSSSASVYGAPKYIPIDEAHPLNPTNPYAQSKKQIEEMMSDLAKSEAGWKIIFLRYFNPVGAHESGLIGESPRGIPNNLVSYIAKVASNELPFLSIFGADYETRDGTGVRDYIHVVDLARGHLAALTWMKMSIESVAVFNLGTGVGTSVLEMISAYELACGSPIEYKKVDRRPGDIAECYAENTKAMRVLGWHHSYDLNVMCRSSWAFSSKKDLG